MSKQDKIEGLVIGLFVGMVVALLTVGAWLRFFWWPAQF